MGFARDNVREGNSTWYNATTGRNFSADMDIYRQNGVPPPFWLEKISPFKDALPKNLWDLFRAKKYEIAGRFYDAGGIFQPSALKILKMLSAAEGYTQRCWRRFWGLLK